VVPKYINDWIHGLLNKYWQCNPAIRLLFREILDLILKNSKLIMKLVKKERSIKEMVWTKFKV
jgi:hypothetical protein